MLIVADDLSGAAEVAAEFARTHGAPIPLALGDDAPTESAAPTVRETAATIAIDTDSRYAPEASARARTRAALHAVPDAPLVFAKVDSLLRGHIGAVVDELMLDGRTVVVTFGHPSAGRVALDGDLLVHGTPLHHTDAWHAESAQPPLSTFELFTTVDARLVPLRSTRDAERLRAELAACAGDGIVPVCDAETAEDLCSVAAAALALGERTALVGTGGLARAVAEVLGRGEQVGVESLQHPTPEAGPRGQPGPHLARRPIVVVAGTRSAVIAEQLHRLRSIGAESVRLNREDLRRGTTPLGLDELPLTVVTLDESIESTLSEIASLAEAVAPSLSADDAHVVLTGGETARRVLDAIGIRALQVLAPLGEGAVLSLADRGRAVVTRPGAFGGPDHLVDVVRSIRTMMEP